VTTPRVLFAGCWGYGNVGDDAYRDLWPRLLPGCECLMDRWGRLADWGRVDAVVIGGGGLVNRIDPNHERRILSYADHAMARGRPLVFASVGAMPSLRNPVGELAAWRPALEYAAGVVARSRRDAALFRAVAPAARVGVAPDLAHLVEPAPARLIEPGRPVVIPYGGEPGGWDRAILPAAPRAAVFLCLSPDDLPVCRELGADPLHSLSAAEVAAVLRDAGSVWSARYHGLVLARAAGRSDAVPARRTWKLDAAADVDGDPWANVRAVEAVVRP
jgi:hypothetical protein